MKYYLIAGEASGDLHASHLMAALKNEDKEAQFRFFGGDLMQEAGGTLVRHYKDLAYMGIFPVLLHLKTILQGMAQCKRDIVEWQPDVVILVDYPGFNLKIARFLRDNTKIPVFYYISPKIWAWKEHRIHDIRRNVDELFSILPFEVEFFEGKHHYPIHYIGNPTVDEIDAFKKEHPVNHEEFRRKAGLDERPIIALLAGSRKQEIRVNLPRMIEAASQIPLPGEGQKGFYRLVLAAAPGIEDSYYTPWIQGRDVTILRGQTYSILQHSTAALVTSGTATLETALFHIPQVVCYYMSMGKIISWGRNLVLKIPYISLVNLVANREVVPELVADKMSARNARQHLLHILPGGEGREAQLEGYRLVAEKLGAPGAPKRAASKIFRLLKSK